MVSHVKSEVSNNEYSCHEVKSLMSYDEIWLYFRKIEVSGYEKRGVDVKTWVSRGELR